MIRVTPIELIAALGLAAGLHVGLLFSLVVRSAPNAADPDGAPVYLDLAEGVEFIDPVLPAAAPLAQPIETAETGPRLPSATEASEVAALDRITPPRDIPSPARPSELKRPATERIPEVPRQPDRVVPNTVAEPTAVRPMPSPDLPAPTVTATAAVAPPSQRDRSIAVTDAPAESVLPMPSPSMPEPTVAAAVEVLPPRQPDRLVAAVDSQRPLNAEPPADRQSAPAPDREPDKLPVQSVVDMPTIRPMAPPTMIANLSAPPSALAPEGAAPLTLSPVDTPSPPTPSSSLPTVPDPDQALAPERLAARQPPAAQIPAQQEIAAAPSAPPARPVPRPVRPRPDTARLQPVAPPHAADSNGAAPPIDPMPRDLAATAPPPADMRVPTPIPPSLDAVAVAAPPPSAAIVPSQPRQPPPLSRPDLRELAAQSSVDSPIQPVAPADPAPAPAVPDDAQSRPDVMPAILEDIERLAAATSARPPAPEDNRESLPPSRQIEPSAPTRPVPLQERFGLTLAEIESIREQIEDHWVLPASAERGLNMIVELRIELALDGTIQSVTLVDQERADVDPIYRALAESTIRAVRRTGQIRNMVDSKYDQWGSLLVTFDPRNVVRSN